MNKIVIFVAVLITAVVTSVGTAMITSAVKNKQFEKIETVYLAQNAKLFELNGELSKMAKYSISNTWTIEKNKKGNLVFVPTNTTEISETVKAINEKINSMAIPVDTLLMDTVKKTSF